ncbi:Ribonuclease R [Gammaproteobacteria bacterium]
MAKRRTLDLLEEGEPFDRDSILVCFRKKVLPISGEDLFQSLQIPEEWKSAMLSEIWEMAREGLLVRDGKGDYQLPWPEVLIEGRVNAHRNGYGFLIPDQGGVNFLLEGGEMLALMHGDRIAARFAGVDEHGKHKAVLVRVLERAVRKVVGKFVISRQNGAVVTPIQRRICRNISIAPEHQGNAKSSQIVIVEILKYPEKGSQTQGKIIEVLGDRIPAGSEIDVAIHSFDLPSVFPPEVEQEAEKFGKSVPSKALAGREDLRSLPLVTIDGEDARDFDDAVYCEREGNIWRLLVAIADVSAYVLPNSPLDEEAQKRGNSVYFPDRAIPMLPEVLSNGLCSLNPGVDRLCMVCELHIGLRGKVHKSRFFPAVMRSAARLTYTTVADILLGQEEACQAHGPLVIHILHLDALYRILRKRREVRGAIDFETTETKIVFGEDLRVKEILPVVRNDAHRLIEECMIAANIASAEFLTARKVPLLYRVHEGPNPEKLQSLRKFLGELGLDLGGGDDPQPKDFGKILLQTQDRPDSHVIQTVLLRSLKQATYRPQNKGHFGLACESYTHFTSPIRRYPDLLVHRALRHALSSKKLKEFRYTVSDLEQFGKQCSMTERRADMAVWDVVAWLKCEYMRSRINEKFWGIVSGVTPFGLFIELTGIYVEGLLHISKISESDYFQFDPDHHQLVGEISKKVFRLGDKVRVRVGAVDVGERKIDLILTSYKKESDWE